VNEAIYSHLSKLQRLQEFCWELGSADSKLLTFRSLAELPGTITSLKVSGAGATTWDVLELDGSLHQDGGAPILPPSMPQLSNLQYLDVYMANISPAVLLSMPQLRSLKLDECVVLNYDEVDESFHQPPVQPVVDLLAVLSKLTLLEKLSIQRPYNWCTVEALAPAFAALTASSRLQYLTVLGEDEPPLPMGAVQHMFPAGRRLPALTSLQFRAHCVDDESILQGWCISGAELHSIADACPALQSVHLGSVLEPGNVPVLLELQGCRDLAVEGAAFCDAALAAVTQLTGLTRLVWKKAPGLTDAGLQQLTTLQVLELEDNPDLSMEVVPHDVYGYAEMELHTTAKVGLGVLGRQSFHMAVPGGAFDWDFRSAERTEQVEIL